jgi:hypothetical protein
MVSSKKRGRQEMEAPEPQEERPMIERIRNMWEFANLAQWIYIFGKAVKIHYPNQRRRVKSLLLTGACSGAGNGVYEESFNRSLRHWSFAT